MTDNDTGKNRLKFGHDLDHDSDLKSRRNAFSFIAWLVGPVATRWCYCPRTNQYFRTYLNQDTAFDLIISQDMSWNREVYRSGSIYLQYFFLRGLRCQSAIFSCSQCNDVHMHIQTASKPKFKIGWKTWLLVFDIHPIQFNGHIWLDLGSDWIL